MAYTIAFAGKGGTGKTSLSALTVHYLFTRRRGPVLAVDADPNACLNEALGVEVHATVGSLREESLQTVRDGKQQRPGGMSMEQLFDYQVQQSIIEAKSFDLIVMGRPEGPGCYCAANNIIRKYTDKLSDSYPYVVIDNEAGLEHLSRRTTNRVNLLIIVSDPTVKGVLTARRINDIVDELALDVERRVTIVNRTAQSDEDALIVRAEHLSLSVAGFIPLDETVARFDLEGRPVIELPEDAPARRSFFTILDSLTIP